MTDVSADQRARVKAAAANAAGASNDAAVVLGASGVIVTGIGVVSGRRAVGAVAEAIYARVVGSGPLTLSM